GPVRPTITGTWARCAPGPLIPPRSAGSSHKKPDAWRIVVFGKPTYFRKALSYGLRGNVAMMIKLVEKERYSIMPPASRHQHDCRILETKDNRIRIKLDRTKDTRPPFFTAYDLSVRRPHPPTINVAGKENWGFGLTWKEAIIVLTNHQFSLPATLM